LIEKEILRLFLPFSIERRKTPFECFGALCWTISFCPVFGAVSCFRQAKKSARGMMLACVAKIES
jgi:hypothetical protein